ncbi:MAG: transcriptional regulator, AsnC family protein [Frankiales bacterium]|nr:transcriptional regulator, AsnC family protein [Frankiales bacterium]
MPELIAPLSRAPTDVPELTHVTSIDRLDADLLAALAQDPRTGTTELAERLGVARNTVQARLSRLATSGVLQGFGARLDLASLGLPVVAFLHLQLAQGALQDVVDALAELPFVLEVVATTGSSDLAVRVAAPDHPALQASLQQVLALAGVVRTTTEIALTTPVPYRVGPLLASLTADRGRGRAGG